MNNNAAHDIAIVVAKKVIVQSKTHDFRFENLIFRTARRDFRFERTIFDRKCIKSVLKISFF